MIANTIDPRDILFTRMFFIANKNVTNILIITQIITQINIIRKIRALVNIIRLYFTSKLYMQNMSELHLQLRVALTLFIYLFI